MGLNRISLIGVVALSARAVTDELGGGEVSIVAVFRPGKSETIDRFRIRSLAGGVPPVGSEVLVEGSVVAQGSRRVVLAAQVIVLAEPEAQPASVEPGGGTHASPAPHERRGHWRTLGRGTARERLVWVRTTKVGDSSDR